MKNKTTIKKKRISLIISPILSLVSFVLTYYIDPLKYTTQSPLAAIPAFLLSILILIIGHVITINNEVEKISDNSELVYETVKNHLSITKMGTPKSAWNYIINRLPVIEYVQNTSFNYKEENDTSRERLYDDIEYEQSLLNISDHINNGLRWIDIGDQTAIDRFERITSKICKKAKGHYKYYLISQAEPQIGFILITYKDGTKEVLFNWDYREIPQDPVVLLSRDNVIFDMFAAQYKGLLHAAVNPYDSKAIKSTS